jgi:hypothetical protein
MRARPMEPPSRRALNEEARPAGEPSAVQFTPRLTDDRIWSSGLCTALVTPGRRQRSRLLHRLQGARRLC